MDALYFRVSSERQTTENHFEDLLQIAERDGSGRDWAQIRDCLIEEERPGPSVRTLVRPGGIRRHRRRRSCASLKPAQIRTPRTWMGPLHCTAPFEPVARARYVLFSTTGRIQRS